mgnify:CR=1 FL=1
MDERGVTVALITDSPILSEESLYHHIGEAVREGVPWMRALRMVTVNRRRFSEWKSGSASYRGKDADLILVKGRLGLDTDAKVLCTMINGQIVYQSTR